MTGNDAEPRDAAWSRVSEQFATLGESLRRRFDTDDPQPAEAAEAVEGGRESLQDAFRTLGDAAERLATTVGSVLRDPDVQTEAKTAASSLVDALGLTFSQVSDEIRRRVDRSGGGDDGAWDEPAPTVEVVEQLETPTTTTPPPPPKDAGPE